MCTNILPEILILQMVVLYIMAQHRMDTLKLVLAEHLEAFDIYSNIYKFPHLSYDHKVKMRMV